MWKNLIWSEFVCKGLRIILSLLSMRPHLKKAANDNFLLLLSCIRLYCGVASKYQIFPLDPGDWTLPFRLAKNSRSVEREKRYKERIKLQVDQQRKCCLERCLLMLPCELSFKCITIVIYHGRVVPSTNL